MATVYKELPNRLFLVRVPIICTYEEVEAEILGMPTTYDFTNDRILDKKAYNSLTTCMLPLTKLIDIYNNGYEVYIVNQEDVSTIYTILDEYLTSTIAVKNNFVLNAELVEEDRIDGIEKFAKEMFGLNKGPILRSMVNIEHVNGFDLNMNLMTPTPRARTINLNETSSNTNNYLPTTQTSYPMTVDEVNTRKKESIAPSIGDVGNYSTTYTTIPTFDIDSIERSPSYRKRYK